MQLIILPIERTRDQYQHFANQVSCFRGNRYFSRIIVNIVTNSPIRLFYVLCFVWWLPHQQSKHYHTQRPYIDFKAVAALAFQYFRGDIIRGATKRTTPQKYVITSPRGDGSRHLARPTFSSRLHCQAWLPDQSHRP